MTVYKFLSSQILLPRYTCHDDPAWQRSRSAYRRILARRRARKRLRRLDILEEDDHLDQVYFNTHYWDEVRGDRLVWDEELPGFRYQSSYENEDVILYIDPLLQDFRACP